jgi:hypothetical protein
MLGSNMLISSRSMGREGSKALVPPYARFAFAIAPDKGPLRERCRFGEGLSISRSHHTS